MTNFTSSKIRKLKPYIPGEQLRSEGLIKLNTNESPFPPSPKVLERINGVAVNSLRLYADPTCVALKEAIADNLGVNSDEVTVGNGSDEILAFLFHGFCEYGAAFADITYGFYSVFCQMFGVRQKSVPLRDDFTINVDDYKGLYETIFVANPNAPTGLCLDLESILKLAEQDRRRLVVVDEAYVDFGGKSAVKCGLDNVLVVRTFSKSRSLAGARIGFAVGNRDIIADLETLRFSFNPYNVTGLSQIAGAAAMEDKEYFDECCGEIIKNREYVATGLRELGFFVLNSCANFVFAGRHNKIGGKEYYTKLREKNILVRHFAGIRTEDFVRITIGTREQMSILLDATEEILK